MRMSTTGDAYAVQLIRVEHATCISMTKMIEEKSARLAPRDSGVVLPGQSHISRGMTVLGQVKGEG